MKCALLLSFLLFSFTRCNAQYNYKTGYIITNEFDTIYGLIEYSNIKANSGHCYFKSENDAQPILYTPNDIQGYIFPDLRYYISKSIIIKGKKRHVFLEYLLKGIVDLYFYADESGNTRYYIEKGDQMIELSNDVTQISDGSKLYSKESKRYIGAFKYLTQDAPMLSPKIDHLKFDNTSFIKIAKEYHNLVCDSVECIVYSKKQKRLNDVIWNFRFGINMGYSIDKLSLSSDVAYKGFEVYGIGPGGEKILVYTGKLLESNIAESFGKTKYVLSKNSLYPGIFLNISPSWRTSFQFELWYKQLVYAYQGQNLKVQSLTLPCLVKREFFYHKKVRPFVELGFSIKYIPKATLDQIELKYKNLVNYNGAFMNDTVEIIHSNYKIVSNKAYLNSILGIGISYYNKSKGNINLEIRREGNILSEYKLSSINYLDDNIALVSKFRFSGIVLLLSYSRNL
jgi:hypothetical protein